ncbi:phytanoyl-CoA dioxygenase family protein [Thalassotalea sp. PS06]|uniref:phytanoyl-CoA dioxygenase family protein n=1 Tax=Thalassotalea sp. PS06 TaxID=2594005 RepID=UPI001165719E|nr:phytanoyl-CoA dioxygenase family protein [Thalassotalea sp. PS06]QDP01079.1 phytanoyl-CoA dioxygenase family protein [Thalassotalea sp. PS06]
MTGQAKGNNSPHIAEYRQSYLQDGYFVISECFSNTQLTSLIEDVQRIYQLWLKANYSNYKHHALINMHGLTDPEYFQIENQSIDHRKRGGLFNKLIPQKLHEIMESVFGDELYFHNTQLFFNPYKNRRKPYWHRDLQYNGEPETTQQSYLQSMLSLHIRIPLMDEEGIELVPGSHSRWDNQEEYDVRFELKDKKNHHSLSNARLLPLKAGDALVFSANMIHRGNYSRGERLALDLCVGNPHSKTIKYLDIKHLPQDKDMTYIDRTQWFDRARQYYKVID